ncbi:hypothetical protein FKM82_019931 [Ascaphus truei]
MASRPPTAEAIHGLGIWRRRHDREACLRRHKRGSPSLAKLRTCTACSPPRLAAPLLLLLLMEVLLLSSLCRSPSSWIFWRRSSPSPLLLTRPAAAESDRKTSSCKNLSTLQPEHLDWFYCTGLGFISPVLCSLPWLGC